MKKILNIFIYFLLLTLFAKADGIPSDDIDKLINHTTQNIKRIELVCPNNNCCEEENKFLNTRVKFLLENKNKTFSDKEKSLDYYQKSITESTNKIYSYLEWLSLVVIFVSLAIFIISVILGFLQKNKLKEFDNELKKIERERNRYIQDYLVLKEKSQNELQKIEKKRLMLDTEINDIVTGKIDESLTKIKVSILDELRPKLEQIVDEKIGQNKNDTLDDLLEGNKDASRNLDDDDPFK